MPSDKVIIPGLMFTTYAFANPVSTAYRRVLRWIPSIRPPDGMNGAFAYLEILPVVTVVEPYATVMTYRPI